MDRIETAVVRGEEAQRILASAVFSSSFDALQTVYVEKLRALETAGREAGGDALDLVRRLQLLGEVRSALETHVRAGKMAAKELTRREKLKDFGRRAASTIFPNSNRSR